MHEMDGLLQVLVVLPPFDEVSCCPILLVHSVGSGGGGGGVDVAIVSLVGRFGGRVELGRVGRRGR